MEVLMAAIYVDHSVLHKDGLLSFASLVRFPSGACSEVSGTAEVDDYENALDFSMLPLIHSLPQGCSINFVIPKETTPREARLLVSSFSRRAISIRVLYEPAVVPVKDLPIFMSALPLRIQVHRAWNRMEKFPAGARMSLSGKRSVSPAWMDRTA
jgi:hypothetical protein